MKYLIVQRWGNTKGNHAGMEHMCDLLVEKYPGEYVKICKDCPPPHKKRDNRIIRKLLHRIDDYIYNREWVADYMKICQPMFDNLKSGDEVFLLEYNWPKTSQYELALYIRKYFPSVRIYGLSHITPSNFSRQKNIRTIINKWDVPIDKQLTLGSTLSSYFKELGVKEDKISTGFHYVDTSYYYNYLYQDLHSKLTIIAMGFLQRDFELLAKIVNSCDNVNWIICRGRKTEIDKYFEEKSNVVLKGFLEEDELRRQMSLADLSLNVLEDTVGSNVITTSISMGLAIIVSNVGSIHDYCDSSNAFFCENNAEDFISTINKLDPILVNNKKQSSFLKKENFRIENVHTWFSTLY